MRDRVVGWTSLIVFAIGILCTPSSDLYAAEEAKILAALKKPIDVDFQATSLADVVRHFESIVQVPVRFDRKGIESHGVDVGETRVTFRLQGRTCETTLAMILRRSHLTYVVDEDQILVTTWERAPLFGPQLIAPVESLILPAESDSDLLKYELTDLLRWSRDEDELRDFEPSRVLSSGRLVASYSHPVHEKMLRCLRAVREAQAASQLKAFRPAVVSVEAVDERLLKALDAPADFDFANASWQDVFALLETRHRLPTVFERNWYDHREHEDPVTFQSRGRSLRRTLDLLARDTDVTWFVDEGVLMFAPNDCQMFRPIRLYCVADLATGDDREQVRDALEELADLLAYSTEGRESTCVRVEGRRSGIATLSVAKSLAVRATDQVHRQIEELLAGIRRIRGPTSSGESHKTGLVTRRYPVMSYRADETAAAKARKFGALVRASIAPDTWGRNGCRVEVFDNELLVTNRTDVQRRVERLFLQDAKLAVLNLVGMR